MRPWQKQNLGEVCLQITDGKHGDCENNPNSGYYFISSKDVFDGDIHFENARQITQEDFIDTHKRTKLEVGDVLITNSGTIGRMAIVRENDKVAKTTFQKSVAILKPNIEKIDNKFLYYFLLSKFAQLTNLGGGAAQHNLLLGDLRKFSITVPDRLIQLKISSIISSYDDLIKNNEKRIKILEEMAQRLYTEWFVKFKFPGHEKIKKVESGTEFGLIPDGWKVKKILDIAREKRDPANPKNIDTETPYVGLEHLPRKSLVLSDWGKASQVGSTKHKFKKGNIIFGKIRPYFHKVVVAPLDGITSTDSIVIEPLDDKYFGLVAMYVSSENFVKFATTTSQGTKMPRAEWKTLTQYPVCIPDGETVEKFNMVITDIIDQMNKLMMINRNLKCIRDLLIPQLVTRKRELKS